MVNFRIVLSLKEPLVVTSSQRFGLRKICTWIKHELSKFVRETLSFLIALVRFYFRKKASKVLKVRNFFSLKQTLVATFNERRLLTSRKCVPGQGILMQNLSETNQSFWLHSSFFALEKQPKSLSFHSFFTCKRIFGCYFQSNTCTYLQKICS